MDNPFELPLYIHPIPYGKQPSRSIFESWLNKHFPFVSSRYFSKNRAKVNNIFIKYSQFL